MSDLAHIVAQETQDGRRIVRFLLSAMDGQLPDFQPSHRLDAARLLVKLGCPAAQSPPPSRPDAPTQRPRQRQPQRPVHPHSPPEPPSGDPDSPIGSQLAQIVRDATDQGRAAVRFLVSVMQGELPDFKPSHRLDAAKELLRRGFAYDPQALDPQQAVPAPAEPAPDPAELQAQRRLQEDIEFSIHGPVYYEIYPYPCVCEDRRHDCNGNALNPQEREKVAHRAPAGTLFIDRRDAAALDTFIARYAGYLTRRNAGNPHPIDFNLIRWPRHPPGPDP